MGEHHTTLPGPWEPTLQAHFLPHLPSPAQGHPPDADSWPLRATPPFYQRSSKLLVPRCEGIPDFEGLRVRSSSLVKQD